MLLTAIGVEPEYGFDRLTFAWIRVGKSDSLTSPFGNQL